MPHRVVRGVKSWAAAAMWIVAAASLSGCTDGFDFSRLAALFPPSETPPQPAPLQLPLPAIFSPSPPPPPPPPPVEALDEPEQVRAHIYRWFMAKGYQGFQAEALMEHAGIESGFRPCAVGAGDWRYTYQWGGLRRQHLEQSVGSGGCPALDKQLAFADAELRNEPTFSCFWRATTEPAALSALRRGFGRGRC